MLPPCMFAFSHTFGCPQCPYMFKHLHMSPMVPHTSACSWGYLHVILGCMGPSSVWTPPICLDASPCVQHLHAFVCSPACLYVLGVISMCYHVLWGENSICWGSGESAHLSGFWCLSVHPLDVIYASSCTFLVVHYVSSLYFHGYDYYYSSDCGVFWYVISIISDHCSLFDGASYTVGSA